jgi:tetratricopeptide (TPR) repeat protein
VTELTIDQALQKGVEAHKAGQIQEADRFYTAILKAQHKHPDANYNMGVLAVGVGKVEQALPFLKTALEANPAAAQFWLSYIDALIRLDKLAAAKAVLDQAKSKGAKGDGFDKLEQRLQEAGQEPLEATRITAEVPLQQPNILDSLKLDQAIKLAKKKAKDGPPEEAKRIYQDILTKFPRNKRARDGLKGLAGRILVKASKDQNPPQDQLQSLINLYSQGQLQEALQEAGSLVKRFSQSAILFNIQGAVLQGLGQLELSLDAYKKALAIKPDYAEAYNNMGNALKENGQLEEAIEAYNKVLAIKPDYAEAYNNMGNALKENGKLEEAIESYNKALAINPNYAEAYYNLGITLKDQGKLEEAIEAYNKTLAIKPVNAEAYYNMGKALKENGELEEAIKTYNKALAIKPDYAEAYNNMGNALKENGKLEEAIEAYNKALAIKPDYAEAYKNMGVTLQDQSKLEEAIGAYNEALAIKPNYADAHRALSRLAKYTPENPQINIVDDLLKRQKLNDSDRCHLLYTNAKMQEDLGDLSAAFDNYVAGGYLRQKLLAYEFTQDTHLFSQIKQTAPKFKDVALNAASEPVTHTPIFILGMPRSGTTLVEQIVSSHSEVTGAGELPYVSQFGRELALGVTAATLGTVSVFREHYLAELAKRADGQAFITDKMPHNFQYIALICAAFPEAKIIHVQRNAEATCWSNFKHHFASKGLGYSYDLGDTVRYYGLYKDLMHFWSQSYSERFYDLDYDQMTENQEPETWRLIEFLELNWQNACLAPQNNKRAVTTASQEQVRQEVYKGSSQAWRKYEPFLDGAFDGL